MRPDEAIINYNRTLCLKPDSPEAYNNLGNVFETKQNFTTSITNYQKAVQLKPIFFEGYNNLGILLFKTGKYADSIQTLKKSLILQPDFNEAYNNIANVFKEYGALENAINSYVRAKYIDPEYETANYNFGCLLYELKRYKEASKFLRKNKKVHAQTYLLRCLYQLDETLFFRQQLDNLLMQGACNALIGSLACQAAIKYGSDIKNPFCLAPLDYILEKDLRRRCNFDATFIDTMQQILNNHDTPSRTQQLLLNGYQTAGDLFLSKSDLMVDIKEIIAQELESYRDTFKNSKEGFLVNWPSNYQIKAWLICMKSGGELSPHIHESGWLSGSIYINVPKGLGPDNGNLVLCTGENKNAPPGISYPEKIINVYTGSLCLFPASLLHHTIPFESGEERIVLAFDMVPV
jgi:Flp pilus assembly protein TadD